MMNETLPELDLDDLLTLMDLSIEAGPEDKETLLKLWPMLYGAIEELQTAHQQLVDDLEQAQSDAKEAQELLDKIHLATMPDESMTETGTQKPQVTTVTGPVKKT